MRKTIGLLFSISIFSAGCTTMPGGKVVPGMPGSPLWFHSTTNQEKQEYIEKTCERYGYQRSSDQWPECIERVMKDLNLQPAFN